MAESELNLIVRLNDGQWQSIPPKSGFAVHEFCLDHTVPVLLRTYVRRGEETKVIEYSDALDIFSVYKPSENSFDYFHPNKNPLIESF